MITPKIEFVYSWIYDYIWRVRLADEHSKHGYPPPSQTVAEMEKKATAWEGRSKTILSEIVEASGLRWREKSIKCYCVGSAVGISDPLTLTPHKSNEEFTDNLTHELIHQILTQNRDRLGKINRNINENYQAESRVTRNHILVYAVESKVHLGLSSKKRFDRKMARIREESHKRAWELVNKEGYKNILILLKRRRK